MNLQDNEVKALKDASLLIKYTAESPKTLPENIIIPIATAWKAQEENTWSPEISSKFWIAYSTLCDLLKPVTLETISASAPGKFRRWFFFGDYVEQMPAKRTASIYRILLIVLLAFAVMFGFVASTTTKLSSDIDKFIADGNMAATDVAASIAIIKGELDKVTPPDDNSLQLSLDDPRITAETRSKITSLRDKLQGVYYDADMMNERVNGIMKKAI
jgi:hypothetical protein